MTASTLLTDLAPLIAEFEASDLRELHARADGLEIHLSRDAGTTILAGGPPAATPVAAPPLVARAAAAPAATWPTTPPWFGRPASAPSTAPPNPDRRLCRNRRHGDRGQRIVPGRGHEIVHRRPRRQRGDHSAVLANDGELVSADQPLFVIGAR